MRNGRRRLFEWVVNRGLNINRCGKLFSPKKELDSQLDVLKQRADCNGAITSLITKKQLFELEPDVITNRGTLESSHVSG